MEDAGHIIYCQQVLGTLLRLVTPVRLDSVGIQHCCKQDARCPKALAARVRHMLGYVKTMRKMGFKSMRIEHTRGRGS